MHEKTTRLFCRSVLLVCCFAPTIALASWIGLYQLTGHCAHFEQVASDLLGAQVTVARVDYPTPLVTVLSGIQVDDPESRQLLLQAESLTLRRGYGQLSLGASTIKLQAERLTRLWELLDRDLFRWSQQQRNPISLKMKELQLVDGTESIHTIRDANGHIKQGKDGLDLLVNLPVGDAEADAPPQLRVMREKRDGQVVTLLNIHTGPSLPAKLFSWRYPVLGALGSGCKVKAELRAELTESGWAGNLKFARFSHVDLAALAKFIPSALMSGKANLLLEDLRFTGGRAQSLRGSIKGTSGRISLALLRSLEDRQAIRVRSQLASDVVFDELRARFLIDGQGLKLTGDCGSASSGVIVRSDHGGAIVAEPFGQVPTVAFVRGLFSEESDDQIIRTDNFVRPTSQAAKILARLPQSTQERIRR